MGKVEIGSEKIYSFMKSCVYSLTQLEMLLLALLLLLDWTAIIKVIKWVKNKAAGKWKLLA